MTTSDFGNHLIYDGDCPFCSQYVRLTRLREALGPVALINARDQGPEQARAVALGFDLNEGMLLHFDGQDHFGADCLNMLALMSTRSGAFNRFTALLFRNKPVARFSYPILRNGRNATLWMLGRAKIG